MSQAQHTFRAWASRWVPWDGTRFGELWVLLVGALPDAQAEAARQLARMLLPVPGTHPENIPNLLRAFGLPGYASEHPLTTPAHYAAALVRIRDAWATHAVAGAAAMLAAELERAGVAGATITNLSGSTEGADLAISVPTSTAGIAFDGGAVFDDGSTYDRQVTPIESRGIAAVIAYFKPARSLFRSLTA